MELVKDLLHVDDRKPKPVDHGTLGFGRILSDHMFLMNYDEGQGWHSPRIKAYGPISLDPAALVLHYGQEVFEGLKAYISADGCVHMFRPSANIQRMNNSCKRLCIPELPQERVLEYMYELVRVERDWIPNSSGTSMYVRPTVIATDPFLGVAVGQQYLFYIIVGPVGAYYPEGFNPIKIYVEEKYVRAVAGGVGHVKTSGNYAASLLAAQEAHAKGFTQVLWLDACERKYVEEVGTMNIFFVIGDEVITPPLGGSILPGVTRDSVIQVCKHWGLNINERRISIDEVIEAQKSGQLKECFGTGTAAVISPVGSIHYTGQDYTVADGQTGELSQKLYDEITGIQLGAKPDPFGWVVEVC